MQIFYCDSFVLPLPPGHRFPMEKYRLLREAVAREGVGGVGALRIPPAAEDAALLRVHDPHWVEAACTGILEPAQIRRIGFPWSPELIERSRRSVGGTLAAGFAALEDGAAANLAGGTHHAFRDRGEGFCVFNDVAVAIKALQVAGRIRRAAVVDLDVHQGNGTAHLFKGDSEVFTASVHGASNYPFRKEKSDLDLALADGTGDAEFLKAVTLAVQASIARGHPDIVFYIAGADPFKGDRLGRLSVSKVGLAERDHIVVEGVRRAGIPLVVVMGGGYAENVHDTVEIHAHSVALATTLTGSVGQSLRPGSPGPGAA